MPSVLCSSCKSDIPHFASLHLLALGERQCLAADSRRSAFLRWSPTPHSLPLLSIAGLAAVVPALICVHKVPEYRLKYEELKEKSFLKHSKHVGSEMLSDSGDN